MMNRRRFLQGKLSLPLMGAWAPRGAKAAGNQRDFLAELGIKGFINAAEPFTTLTGALMPPEVREAWDYGVSRYVRLSELHDAVGKRIAALIGAKPPW